MRKQLAKKLSLFFAGIVLLTSIILTSISFVSYKFIQQKVEGILYDNTLESYKAEIKSEVQSAVSLVDNYYEQYENGTLKEDDAKEQALEALRNLRYGDDESGYFWVDNTNYTLVMHPILSDQEGTNRKDLEDKNGVKIIQKIMDTTKNGNGGYNEFYFTKSDGKTVAPKVAYSEPFEKWNWVITTGIYTDDIEGIAASSSGILRIATICKNCTLFLIVAGIGLAVIMLFIAYFIIRSLIKAINEVKNNLELVATGDFTGSINKKLENREDEIGQMVKHTKNAIESFKESLSESKTTAETVNRSSAEIKSVTFSALDATGQVAEAIENVASDATNQAGAVSEVVGSVGQINLNADNLTIAVSDIQSCVKTLDKSSAEMKSHIKDMSDGSELMTGQITNISDKIAETNEAISQMSDILKTIDEIASQTNLLALNASIEAAHAGEKGKGFAVVAENIKNLAGNTASELVNVKDIIKNLTNSFKECASSIDIVVQTNKTNVETTENVITSFDEVFGGISATDSKLKEITVSVKEMKDIMSEISEQMSDISKGAESTAAATEEITASSEELTSLMNSITNDCDDMSKKAEEMNSNLRKFKL